MLNWNEPNSSVEDFTRHRDICRRQMVAPLIRVDVVGLSCESAVGSDRNTRRQKGSELSAIILLRGLLLSANCKMTGQSILLRHSHVMAEVMKFRRVAVLNG
jgi:hypothetical protein